MDAKTLRNGDYLKNENGQLLKFRYVDANNNMYAEISNQGISGTHVATPIILSNEIVCDCGFTQVGLISGSSQHIFKITAGEHSLLLKETGGGFYEILVEFSDSDTQAIRRIQNIHELQLIYTAFAGYTQPLPVDETLLESHLKK